MTDRPPQEHWDDLVKQLGIEPQPSTPAPEPFEPPKRVPPPRRPSVSASLSRTTDWSGIARSLGITPPAETAPLPPKKPEAAKPPAPPASSSAPSAAVPPPLPTEAAAPPPLPVPPAAWQESPESPREQAAPTTEPAFEEGVASEGEASEPTEASVEEAERRPRDRSRKRRGRRGERPDRRDRDSASAEEPVAEPTAAEGEPLDSGEAAEGENGEPARGKRRRRRRRKGKKEGTATKRILAPIDENEADVFDEDFASLAEEAVAGALVDDDDLELIEADSDQELGDAEGEALDEEGKPDRKRRRRRRRKGKPTEAERTPLNDVETTAADALSLEADDDVALGADDADLDSDEEDSDSDDRGPRGLRHHKNIPSWEETVGVVISSNMENRNRGRSRGRR